MAGEEHVPVGRKPAGRTGRLHGSRGGARFGSWPRNGTIRAILGALVARVILLLLVASTLVLLPATARSAPKEVQVLGVMSDDALPQAQAITEALRTAVDHKPGFSLAEGEYSLEVMTVALRCPDPPDQACLARIAQKIGAERYIWGNLRKEPKHKVALHLSYWEKGSNQRDATLSYGASLHEASDDALQRIANELVDRLLGPADGTLVVRMGNLDGEVFVNGESRGKLVGGRAQLTLNAGDVEVRVAVEGYRDAQTMAQVPAGGSTEVTLEPVPLARESSEREEPTPTSTRGNRKLVGGVILGAGAAIAIAGGFFWWASSTQNQNEDYQDYRATVPKGVDPCDQAKIDHAQTIIDLCEKNRTNRILGWILTPVGVVTMGVGGYLLATSPSRQAGSRAPGRVTPLIGLGPKGGSLDLRVSF